MDDLPWAPPLRPWQRCRAVLEPEAAGAGPYFGRCELRRGHAGDAWDDHALERGMDVVRWATVVSA